MIRATNCPDCGRSLFYPDEWAKQSVECPQCKSVVPLQPVSASKSGDGDRRRLGRATRLTSVLLLLAGVLFAVTRDETSAGLENPPVRLRCLLCGTSFERPRADWESRVFAVRPLLSKGERLVFRLPETTPIECPKCHLKSAYVFDKTLECQRCGKFRLKEDPSLGSEFSQLSECPTCVSQTAFHRHP